MNTSQLSIILNYLKYYSSKTVTQILGVTAQTLRNWDKEDKLKPAYVNSNEHVFNYSYYNNSLHKVTCICGYDKNEPHVVESTILTKAMCLLCGRLINLDSGIGQVIKAALYRPISNNSDDEIFDKYNVSYVLLNKKEILSKILDKDLEYKEIYSDKYFVLFEKNTGVLYVLTVF